LIFHSDVPDYPEYYRLTASNPGQFYYNVFYVGDIIEDDEFILELPYPFVTQGANPVHVYSSLNTDCEGCILPIEDITSQFDITGEPVTLGTGYNEFGQYSYIHVKANSDYTGGFIYINVHLDYGLKKNIGGLNGNLVTNDAESVIDITYPVNVNIENDTDYIFSVIGPYSFNSYDIIKNLNVFKTNPGIGGFAIGKIGDPIPGKLVQIYKDEKPYTDTLTDEDGWFMCAFKHIGKPTAFTIKTSGYPDQTIILKANKFAAVIFDYDSEEESGTINNPPTASYTYSSNDLIVDFTDTSTDSDGSIVFWSWDFGDGKGTSPEQNPIYTYDTDGTYTVTLTVTDDGGITDVTSQDITVSSGSESSTFNLIATCYKVRGKYQTDLEWSGALSADVDIYRDEILIATIQNDGFYTDYIDFKGGECTYQIFEAGSTLIGSNTVTVYF
jgi:hypothetical protein